MSGQGVLPSYAVGPSFLFESFAEFNELILADYLAKQASDPALKRYYLEEWLNVHGLDAFYGAQDALLEQAVYDGMKSKKVNGPDDLDRITLRVDSQFSIWPEIEPEMRARWAAVSLAYEDPLYDVNYAYAGLLALKYFDLCSKRPDWFASGYLALLANGFDRPPAALLRDFLNIDLNGDSLLTDDLQLLDGRLRALEADTPKR